MPDPHHRLLNRNLQTQPSYRFALKKHHMTSVYNLYQQCGKSSSFTNTGQENKNYNIHSLDKYQTPSFLPDVPPLQTSLQSFSVNRLHCVQMQTHKTVLLQLEFVWEIARGQQTKNPGEILKPPFSQEFPGLPHPPNPLGSLFPRIQAGQFESRILELHLAQIRMKSEVKISQQEEKEKRKKGSGNTQRKSLILKHARGAQEQKKS